MTWIVGDVSGSETLTSQDHLYESHLNQLRESMPATIVVGRTSNCQYYCDGTDDHVQIQAALDALPANGGKVLLREGTYTLGDSLVMDSYQRLEGMGKGTILKAKNSLNKDMITTQTATFNRYTEIYNLTIDGNRANNTDGRGIYLTSPRNCRIDGVWIKETDSDAIRMSGVEGTLGWYNWIVNSEIDNCDNGINITGYCEHNYIVSNTITFIVGIGLFADSDLDHILNNKFDQCTGACIHLEFGAGAWTVSGNSFDNGSSHHIILRSADKTKIIGNFFGTLANNMSHIVNGPNGDDGSDKVLISNNIMCESTNTGTTGIKELTATDRCRYVDNIINGPDTAVTIHASSTNNTNSNTT